MSKQMIISISREYGSGGHEIAKILSERLGIAFYDRNMLDEIAAEMEADVEKLKKYDEKRRIPIIRRTVRGLSNSPEDAIAEFQFDYIRKKADSGESFVVVGRCSEHILRQNENMIPIFILSDEVSKRKRIEEVRNVSSEEAMRIMTRHDKTRKYFHNYYCPNKWGDSRGYALTIDSGKIGIEGSVELILKYIDIRSGKTE